METTQRNFQHAISQVLYLFQCLTAHNPTSELTAQAELVIEEIERGAKMWHPPPHVCIPMYKCPLKWLIQRIIDICAQFKSRYEYRNTRFNSTLENLQSDLLPPQTKGHIEEEYTGYPSDLDPYESNAGRYQRKRQARRTSALRAPVLVRAKRVHLLPQRVRGGKQILPGRYLYLA